ncbi:MAG: hypothetical protein U9N11_08440 [Campylobacterota bacterium]|nr:hypothetical protein [Campylobacterota bacterium]
MKKIIFLMILSLGIHISLYANEIELYKKSCDAGDAGGCFNLGLMYVKGEGVKQDSFKAKYLFGKSCDAGLAEGCKNYAILNKK